ncbi:LLM class flavin-dependent oxidoreductase [Pseudoclavibacter sp. RFBJ3]|uniref:LLM class flavin-dependent oxidoreductase n=1 Tax=unclassified Pseudoclavibacter TaxID=2615177 RepID=UPI000CE8E1D0|nr:MULTISPECIES: LLM class flavin-dependent oxidoreductase [unclassified Pseudoclavibacter]PPF87523.1 LLM class flavin-dependent oxidoreductase [Pseudoclavibacter sp. RFBJ5]PPF90373.1 LLM class flavin-dependent oxidoreductase [Pseudoclavibacter sp. RFBJ3]PPG01058.1 LLM class flavin-dependent oxidoreductase [Pseudoclavibacter sp. RFBH5]PPG26161.1 LLM class flavin-dependent oxidoreductase [Pseudoclavibacter sp. RFBI4]
MQPVPPSGTAPFALSVLDNALTGAGTPASAAYRDVVDLAKIADRRGFQRFWMSEHHGMPGASTSSPQLMLARLTGETERIRLGAGGVMLPNHAPLLVAEQFGMLNALAPARIDLGVGRAPGTDQPTAAALRRHRDANDQFPEQIAELVGFLEDDFPAGHPYQSVHAVPGPWQAAENRVPHEEGVPQLWVLGSSNYSAHLAAQLGRPYAFALQFGRADVASALRIYREKFRPSVTLAAPHAMVSVSVAAHDDPDEARRQTSSTAMAMLRMFQRRPYALLPPEEVAAYSATLEEQQVLDHYMANTIHGSGEQVGDALERLHQQTKIDEIMLVTGGHSREIQTRTVELMADHFGLAR